jgi:hypothetical protein
MNAVVAPSVEQLLARLAEIDAELARTDVRDWQLDYLEAERRALLVELKRRQGSESYAQCSYPTEVLRDLSNNLRFMIG